MPPLEALWWAEDMCAFTADRDKSHWDWTGMLLVPDWLDHDDVERARAAAARNGPPALDRVRLEGLEEGRCVQTLHLGPSDDGIPARGLQLRGKQAHRR